MKSSAKIIEFIGAFSVTLLLLMIGLIPVITKFAEGADVSDAVDDNTVNKDAVADTGTETNFANIQNDIVPDADYMNIQESDTGSAGIDEDLASSFAHDLAGIGEALVARIEREEGTLYPLYRSIY